MGSSQLMFKMRATPFLLCFFISLPSIKATYMTYCQSDYSKHWLEEYCSSRCKYIGLKGRNFENDGKVMFPSEVFGIYRWHGTENLRSVYKHENNSMMIKYGCIDGWDGLQDGWYVTINDDQTGAVLHSPHKTTCPDTPTSWRVRPNPSSSSWSLAGRYSWDTTNGDYLQLVCNPKEDFMAIRGGISKLQLNIFGFIVCASISFIR